jgi:hypothetical protein
MAWAEEWGGLVIILIAATSYIMVFAFAGQYLWFKSSQIHGGLLVTTAVCILLLIAIYGIQVSDKT